MAAYTLIGGIFIAKAPAINLRESVELSIREKFIRFSQSNPEATHPNPLLQSDIKKSLQIAIPYQTKNVIQSMSERLAKAGMLAPIEEVAKHQKNGQANNDYYDLDDEFIDDSGVDVLISTGPSRNFDQ
jgi:hypothetical protein